MGKLDGTVALVTGASKGIGAGIALSLANEGAAVAVNYHSDLAGAAYLPLQDINEKEFHRQFDTNVLGLLLTSKRAVKGFGEKGGCIINIGSVASKLTPPASSIYAATKSAVDGITRVLAKELGPRNIRVNSINPGVVDTEGARAMDSYDQVANAIEGLTSLGRTGMPEDIGLIATFLASEEARWLPGEIISGSGGLR